MKFIKFLHKVTLPIGVALNVLIAGIAIFSAFGAAIDPQIMPFAGVAQMTFPIWWIFTVVLLILDLIFCRLLAPVPAAALLICIKPFLVFCPLNFGSHELKPDQEARAFKVLSYNTLSFVDFEGEQNKDFNRTMHQILSSDADVVVLLEYENQGKLTKFVPASQIDSLHTLYPYFERGHRGTVMYSRRPIMHIIPPDPIPSKGSIEAFRTQVNERPINVFAVHLESIGLDDSDKQLYREITDNSPERMNVGAVRNQLINKLYYAFRSRAKQAMQLREYVEYLGGNSVVCGDFNDVPGCRAIRVLEEAGMQDVYAKVGFGPTITYNAPHFFFRIDHVLWRGDFKPVSIRRGDIPSSDHYPMLTTFVWND